MRSLKIFLTVVFLSVSSPLALPVWAGAHASEACLILDGAKIIAGDGEYIGSITNDFSSESICNEFGTYGNEFGSYIWNEFSTYGNEFNSLSPFNEFSSNPPKIIKNGNIIGYLTVNEFVTGAVHPDVLCRVCYGVDMPR